MKISLNGSLLIFALILVSAPMACVYLFSEIAVSRASETARERLQETVLANAVRANIDICRMCEIAHTSDKNFENNAKRILLAELAKLGKPSLAKEAFEREIRPQDDSQGHAPEKRRAKIRLLKFGKTAVDCANAEDLDDPVNSLLNGLKQRLGCDFTIFVKMNPEWDMLRLASTYSDALGENLAGSYFSGYGSIRRDSIVRALAENTEYSGISEVFDTTTAVLYIPIADAGGEVIGALFIGSDRNSAKDAGKFVMSANLGKNSSAWIIDDSAPDNPVIRFSERQSSESVSINNDISSNRKNFAYEIIEKSRALKAAQVGSEIFRNPSSPDKSVILTYAYYRPWNWIIGTITESEEYAPEADAIAGALKIPLLSIIKAWLLFTAAAVTICAALSKRVGGDIKTATRILSELGKGNPGAARLAAEEAENRARSSTADFSELHQPLKSIAKHFEYILDEIAADAENLGKTSAQISRRSAGLDENNYAELAQMKDIARSGRNILDSADALNKTTVSSAAEIRKALNLNKDSENAIDMLMRKYETLAAASNNAAKKLADINENAEKITELITAISDVSLKTNMLSLNASIEAEKVGESGLGFAVVSRRIRTLAGKTSKASEDIEQIVRQMQSSVNAGVMEMDKFASDMRSNTEIAVKSARKLSLTISNIESIGPKFENISERISEMSAIAVRITEAIKNLAAKTTDIKSGVSVLRAINAEMSRKSLQIKKSAKPDKQ